MTDSHPSSEPGALAPPNQETSGGSTDPPRPRRYDSSGEGPAPRNLAEVMDDLTGSEPVELLTSSNSASRDLAEQVGDVAFAETLIASGFWWAFSRSYGFRAALRMLSGPESGRNILVAHAQGTRIDLLVFTPALRGEPRQIVINPYADPFDLEDALEVSYYRRRYLLRGEDSFPYLRSFDYQFRQTTLLDAILQVPDVRELSVAILPAPPEVPTSLAPSPAVSVHLPDGSGGATLGVVGFSNRLDHYFATTALHWVPASARALVVNGDLCEVVSKHQPTDSCVIRLECSTNSIPCKGAGGTLRRVMPVLYGQAHFDGATSGLKRTRIIAADLDILDPNRYLAAKIQTEPDTLPGDSGSGLIDDNDRVVGFASTRSAFGVEPAYSSWVCAEQVLRIHEVD